MERKRSTRRIDDVGQETLVSPHEGAELQWRFEVHQLTQPQWGPRAVSPSIVLLSDCGNRRRNSRAMRPKFAPITAADLRPDAREFADQSDVPIFLAAAEMFW